MKKTFKKLMCALLVVIMTISAAPLNGFTDIDFDSELFSVEANAAGIDGYCATAAAAWAEAHLYDYYSLLYGTGYWNDGGDCANYVSQALYMGGMDMDNYWNIAGYKAHWGTYYGNDYSGSYIRCQQLYNYLVYKGAQVINNPAASQVSVGDVILYKRNGSYRMTHSAIVIAIENGIPVVAAHSTGTNMYTSREHNNDWHLNFCGSNTYLMKLYGDTCVNENPRSFDVYIASGGDLKLHTSASASSGYYNTFISGEYAHVYKKSADGKWGYAFRYGKWGWIKLSSFNYSTHIDSPSVGHLFGDWTTVQTANCIQDGIDKRVCQRCGYTETKTTKGGHVADPRATCLENGYCKYCGVACENPLGHNWDNGTVTTQPTCTKEGVKTYVCKRDSSHTYTEPVAALGHNYQTSVTSPTCTANGETIYKCSRCSDSYIVANPSGGWSDWTTDSSLASTLSSDKVQKKTQYRYSDYSTTTSTATSLSGWTQNGGSWIQSGSGTIDYVDSWPSGFSTSNSLYSTYNKTPKTASETTTNKVTVSTSTPGYIYWHWCRNDQSLGLNYSRLINDYYTSEFSGFHAFYSTTAISFNSSANAYEFPSSSTCNDSYWWYRLDVKRCSYTEYYKLFNYYKWSDYSAWQDTAVSSSSTRKVETRTLYKYDLSSLGHNWVNDSTVQVCQCGTDESDKYCYAVGQYCSRCGVTNPDATKYYEHSYGSWYEISNDNGVKTYRADCTNSNCDCYKVKSESSCNYVLTSSKDATCTSDGYEIWTCSYHGETKTIITEQALGHKIPDGDAGILKVAPTCTEKGEIWHYCVRFDDGATCNHYEIEYIDATGHSMTHTEAKEPTCTEDGNDEYYYCNICRKYFSDEEGKTETEEGSWIIPAKNHCDKADVEWTVVKEASCGVAGRMVKYCEHVNNGEVCNHIIDEKEIPEIEADWIVISSENAEIDENGEWVPTRCDAEGIIGITCGNCINTEHPHSPTPGDKISYESIGILEHLPGDEIIDSEAYCIYPGHSHTECERCGQILEENDIPAPCESHNLKEIESEDGCISKECTNSPCTYIEPGTHNFVRDTSLDKAPTCTQEGIEGYKCNVCGKTNNIVTDPTGHNHTLTETLDAKCTTPGYDKYICTNINNGEECGDIVVKNHVNPLGHDMGEWYVFKKPTIDTTGLKRRDCQRTDCDYHELAEIPVLDNFTVTFIVRDENGTFEYEGEKYTIVETVRDAVGVTAISVPSVPEIEGYVGRWEDFTVPATDTDIFVKAQYAIKDSSNESDLIPEKTATYKDGIATITLSAFAESMNAKVTLGATPYDIVLVLDQSGSMRSVMSGQTRLKVLQNVAKDFVDKVYTSAVDGNVNHRISVVAFSGANNSGLMTPSAKLIKSPGNENYAASWVNVLENKEIIDDAIDNLSTGTGTRSDLGLDLASGVLSAVKNDTDRKRLVLFITDGDPTNADGSLSGSSYSGSFSTDVANNAIDEANQLKNIYGASVYSIGVATDSDPDDETENMNKFMHYVSSNYPDATNLKSKGTAAASKNYYIVADNADTLSSIFDNIFAQQVSNTISFDTVTFVDTVSEYFTFTIEQEEAFRSYLKSTYGINDDKIIITRNEDGTTNIVVKDVATKPVYENGMMTGYAAEISFNVTANSNALDAGIYSTNTSDAGIEKDDIKVEAFEIPSITIPADRYIVEFIVDGQTYSIIEGDYGDTIDAPEYKYANWNITDGTVISDSYTVFYGTLITEERAIKWNIGDNVIEQTYQIGQQISVPEVSDTDNEIFVGWNMAVPARMPEQNLEITALFMTHTHEYKIIVTGDCLTGVTTIFTCDCGDTFTLTETPGAHEYVAKITENNNETIASVSCPVCGYYDESVINYQAVYNKDEETNHHGLPGNKGNKNANGAFANKTNNTVTQAIDLTLLEENITIQPGSESDYKIIVKIPLTDELLDYEDELIVYRLNEDNTKDEVEFTSDGVYLTLYLDHFSYYIISCETYADSDPDYNQVECAFNGHEYECVVSGATALKDTYMTYTCANCQDTYKTTEVDGGCQCACHTSYFGKIWRFLYTLFNTLFGTNLYCCPDMAKNFTSISNLT